MSKKNKQAALAAKPVGGIALAAKWPVHEVLLSQGWEKEAALITIEPIVESDWDAGA